LTLMRTVFALTSQGSPYSRFRRALDTCDLGLVRAAAELPSVPLEDALRVCLLLRGANLRASRASFLTARV
jgi:hypothetical protein